MAIQARQEYDNFRFGYIAERVDSRLSNVENLTLGIGLISGGGALSYYTVPAACYSAALTSSCLAAAKTASIAGMIGIGFSGISIATGGFFALKAIINYCSEKPRNPDELDNYKIKAQEARQREKEIQKAEQKEVIKANINEVEMHTHVLVQQFKESMSNQPGCIAYLIELFSPERLISFVSRTPHKYSHEEHDDKIRLIIEQMERNGRKIKILKSQLASLEK